MVISYFSFSFCIIEADLDFVSTTEDYEQSAVLGTLCFDRLDVVPAYIAYANAADSEIRKAVISDDESVLGLNCLKEVVECGIREKYNSEDACDVEDRDVYAYTTQYTDNPNNTTLSMKNSGM